MKTTLPAPSSAAARARGRHVHPSTLRLGLVLSLVAAVLAIVVEAVVHLPVVLDPDPGRDRRVRPAPGTPAVRASPPTDDCTRRPADRATMASMKVRIGLGLGVRTRLHGPEFGDFVDTVERLRFDSLWLSERITGEAPDPVVAMSYAAGRTTHLKFGMSVLVLPGRNPIVLAKEMATLAIMSGGRLLPAFGLGVADGMEHQAFGVAARRAGGVVRRGADRHAQVLVRRRRRPRRRALPLRGPQGPPAAEAPRRVARAASPRRSSSGSGGWPTAGCRRS